MITINVKENESIDRALKRFKKKFERAGVIREVRDRSFFTKKSVIMREIKLKAQYIQKIRDREDA